MRFTVNEIDKSNGRPKKNQNDIPEKVKREIGNHALTFGTSSDIKKDFGETVQLTNVWARRVLTVFIGRS